MEVFNRDSNNEKFLRFIRANYSRKECAKIDEGTFSRKSTGIFRSLPDQHTRNARNEIVQRDKSVQSKRNSHQDR